MSSPRKTPVRNAPGGPRPPTPAGGPLRPLRDLMTLIGGVHEEHSALRAAVMAVCDWTGWDVGEAWVPRPGAAVLECSPACFVRDSSLDRFRSASMEYTFAPGEGLPGRVWASGRTEHIEELKDQSHFLRFDPARKAGLRRGVAVPIPVGEEIQAVLAFYTRDAGPAPQGLDETLADLAVALGLVIRRLRAEEALRRSEARFRAISAPVARRWPAGSPRPSSGSSGSPAAGSGWRRTPRRSGTPAGR
ncbi:MAG: GAF domain-containing protein [Planctomycetes bacterium]|nr:GAF domain-containing protein [Planctomycetota bacterium]